MDYLRVGVKAGVTYLIATFDLVPGVDTVLESFWWNEEQPLPNASNDDYAPGGMLSAVTWTAPADGHLLLRVAPRTGGSQPATLPSTSELVELDTPNDSRYRFAIVPAASALADAIRERITEQANVPPLPTPVAAPSGGVSSGASAPPPTPAPVPTPTSRPVSQSPTGVAVVTVEQTTMHLDPSDQPLNTSEVLAVLTYGDEVTLRGSSSGVWVQVEIPSSVLPGWVDARHVQRGSGATRPLTPTHTLPTTTTMAPEPTPVAATPASSQSAPPTRRTPAPITSRTPPAIPTQAVPTRMELLPPLPPPPPPTPDERQSVTVQVTVVGVDADELRHAQPDDVPDLDGVPVVGIRVQLVNPFGDVLTQADTDDTGQVVMSHPLLPAEAVLVRIPSAGLDVPVQVGPRTPPTPITVFVPREEMP